MTKGAPEDTEIARKRVRRAKLSLGIRVPGLILLGLLLLYVGSTKIAKGDDVAMWTAILGAYALASTVATWLILRGVEHARK